MRWLSLVVWATACSSARYGVGETGAPSLILPAHIAEGDTGKDGGGVHRAAAENGDGGPAAPASALPDPEPLVTRYRWDYSLDYDRGAIRVAAVRAVTEARPVATARRVGRFAFELWVGHELVDRVRFDFPLLAVDEPRTGSRRPLHEGTEFGPGARTSARVRVPASDRATSARVVDRATGRAIDIPWPPVPPPAPAVAPSAASPHVGKSE